MLAKCANPSCFASFRSLQEGRLFRLEADAIPPSTDFGDSGKAEYFWLCRRCSQELTLRLNENGAVSTRVLPDYAHHHSQGFAIISRHEGKLLRSVAFSRNRRPETT